MIIQIIGKKEAGTYKERIGGIIPRIPFSWTTTRLTSTRASTLTWNR